MSGGCPYSMAVLFCPGAPYPSQKTFCEFIKFRWGPSTKHDPIDGQRRQFPIQK
jgi:hypothetical protein